MMYPTRQTTNASFFQISDFVGFVLVTAGLDYCKKVEMLEGISAIDSVVE
jgi:hypothetical protein